MGRLGRKYAEEINVNYVKLFSAIPLRNTRLWDLCEKEGVFRKGFNNEDVRWSTGQIETKEFSSNDLTILRAYEWDRINFSTHEKRSRTAEMMDISVDELYTIRRTTINGAHKLIQ